MVEKDQEQRIVGDELVSDIRWILKLDPDMSFCLPVWMDLFHPAERFGSQKKITQDRCGDDQKLHLAHTSFNECLPL